MDVELPKKRSLKRDSSVDFSTLSPNKRPAKAEESPYEYVKSALERKDYDTAINICTSEIKSGKKCAFSYFVARSTAYSKLNSTKLALRDAKEAVKLCPDNPKGYVRAAHSLHAHGYRSKALEALQIARNYATASQLSPHFCGHNPTLLAHISRLESSIRGCVVERVPAEILIEIGSWLKWTDLVATSCVCKAWRNILQTPILWRYLSMSSRLPPTRAVREVDRLAARSNHTLQSFEMRLHQLHLEDILALSLILKRSSMTLNHLALSYEGTKRDFEAKWLELLGIIRRSERLSELVLMRSKTQKMHLDASYAQPFPSIGPRFKHLEIQDSFCTFEALQPEMLLHPKVEYVRLHFSPMQNVLQFTLELLYYASQSLRVVDIETSELSISSLEPILEQLAMVTAAPSIELSCLVYLRLPQAVAFLTRDTMLMHHIFEKLRMPALEKLVIGGDALALLDYINVSNVRVLECHGFRSVTPSIHIPDWTRLPQLESLSLLNTFCVNGSGIGSIVASLDVSTTAGTPGRGGVSDSISPWSSTSPSSSIRCCPRLRSLHIMGPADDLSSSTLVRMVASRRNALYKRQTIGTNTTASTSLPFGGVGNPFRRPSKSSTVTQSSSQARLYNATPTTDVPESSMLSSQSLPSVCFKAIEELTFHFSETIEPNAVSWLSKHVSMTSFPVASESKRVLDIWRFQNT